MEEEQLPVLTVGELTRQIRDLMECEFPLVAVRGEVSNATRASAGHLYFTLKDDTAQLRAVMWRTRASRLRFDLRDGLDAVAVGRIEVYPARGTYQLVVEELLPQGVGPLELAFRQLHQKLAAEGLFSPERKRPLPWIPQRIALVTSPTGAAVRDMLQVLTRRWPPVNVVIVPVPVQGVGAAARIAAGIQALPRITGVDVAIVGRGGGSLEDLWAFNEEVLARAVAASPIPIVSAVGHEIDVTICDLVADRRALTPSEAGELVVPEYEAVVAAVDTAAQRAGAVLGQRVQLAQARLDRLARHPALTRPLDRIEQLQEDVDEWAAAAERAMTRHLEESRQRVVALATAVDALSPLRVLARGYSITQSAATGQVLRSSTEATPGQELITQLERGTVRSRVVDTVPVEPS